jgi:bacterioferritin (cytochrome b1)
MDKGRVLTFLNEALAQEHACQIRYRTHAAVLTGPYTETVANRLEEIADDEAEHADTLRDRLTALGEVPVMEVKQEDLIPARKLKPILDVNIAEEKKAFALYRSLLKMIEREEVILFEAVEHFEDEQEHLEELERLQE